MNYEERGFAESIVIFRDVASPWPKVGRDAVSLLYILWIQRRNGWFSPQWLIILSIQRQKIVINADNNLQISSFFLFYQDSKTQRHSVYSDWLRKLKPSNVWQLNNEPILKRVADSFAVDQLHRRELRLGQRFLKIFFKKHHTFVL